MSVRITQTIDHEQTMLRVAGRLAADDVSLLDREVRSLDGPLVVDLSELVSADTAGIVKLRDLASGRVELRGVSHYVQLLLDLP